jgi:hypothetical protein
MSDRNLARAFLKELTSQLKVEDATYEALAVRLVGGDKPLFFSLSAPEVRTEPLFWPLIFKKQGITEADIESAWGVRGPLLLSFSAAFEQQYGPVITPWIQTRIAKVVEYVALLARAYLSCADIDTAAEVFYLQHRMLFAQASDVLDHLDWNRVRQAYGKKDAHRFRLHRSLAVTPFHDATEEHSRPHGRLTPVQV